MGHGEGLVEDRNLFENSAMTPERWTRIKEVFGTAVELPEDERAAFLKEACSAEPSLRGEVERLLEAETLPLENPIIEALSRAAPRDLARGEMLGPYRIETKIGRGGMGVVYRAWDTRLDRRIALKVLRQHQGGTPSHLQSLQSEARAACALIHPNIVTVHDIGCDRDIDFIAMEYVDGRPLQEVIPATGLPLKQAIGYAIPIANAMAAANAAGLVHGDLKPGNIMITPEGAVKLLDFGLARRTLPSAGGAAHSVNGVIAGTPQYMAPELLRGEPIDHRADIFSFGVVLYRMLTGRDLFDSDSVDDAKRAILESDIPEALSAGPPVHPAIGSVILHCLEKSPADRFQSARDVAYALEAASHLLSIQPQPAPPPRLRTYALWSAGLLLSVALGILVSFRFLVARLPHPSVDGRAFAQITDNAGAELFPSLSADGQAVVYASKAAGNWNIYLKQIGASETFNVTKDSTADDTQPAFSPDGKLIAFRSERDGGGIFVMNRNGSSVRKIAPSGYNPAWSPDSARIAYAEESITRPEDRSGRISKLWVVDVASGSQRPLGDQDGVQPQWSPNGEYLAYWAIDRDGDRDLWTARVSGGPPTRITRDQFLDWNPVWSPDGDWLYFCSNRGGSMDIWRIPMREGFGEARGVPEPVRSPAQYPAHLTFSRDGRRMAYSSQITTGHISAVRFDPEREAVVSEPKEILKSSKGASRRRSLRTADGWLITPASRKRSYL
jgi:serine/threonine protein kinase